jgi:hypothetical protein
MRLRTFCLQEPTIFYSLRNQPLYAWSPGEKQTCSNCRRSSWHPSEASPSRPTQRLLGDRGLACTRRLRRSLRPEHRPLRIRTCCFSCRDRNGSIENGAQRTHVVGRLPGPLIGTACVRLQGAESCKWVRFWIFALAFRSSAQGSLSLGLDTWSYRQIMRSRSRGWLSHVAI